MNIFFASALILAIYMTTLFVIAVIKRDNSIADIGYGFGFILITGFAFFSQDITQSHRSIIISTCILLWGGRLMYRIGRKNWSKHEDFRYKAWRTEWQKKGEIYLLLRSFLQVFVLQGIIIYLVSLSGLFGNTMQIDTMKWYNYAGAMLWVTGFLFEFVGDIQLDRFLKSKQEGKEKSHIMKTGLWKYTRHPNYFGESLQWWGLALVCLFGVNGSLIVFVSPILITYLLLFISGIPLLEKRWAGDKEWEEYKKKTNAFVPGPQK